MYRTIVVGAHKSESARRATTEAIELARVLDSHVHLVTAYSDDGGPVDGADSPARAAAQRDLDAFVPPVGSHRFTTHALPGDPAKAISRAIGSHRTNDGRSAPDGWRSSARRVIGGGR